MMFSIYLGSLVACGLLSAVHVATDHWVQEGHRAEFLRAGLSMTSILERENEPRMSTVMFWTSELA
jgi:hypothetical protein